MSQGATTCQLTSLIKSYIVVIKAPEIRALIITVSGQLLVVAHHTDASPSLCYEPELIPDPLCYVVKHNSRLACAMDLGSDAWTIKM